MKINKERLKDIAIGAAIGATGAVTAIIVSGIGGKIAKDAFCAGVRMAECKLGVDNTEFEEYAENLYDEYLYEEE